MLKLQVYCAGSRDRSGERENECPNKVVLDQEKEKERVRVKSWAGWQQRDMGWTIALSQWLITNE